MLGKSPKNFKNGNSVIFRENNDMFDLNVYDYLFICNYFLFIYTLKLTTF